MEEIGIASQARADPTSETDVALAGGTALFLQLLDPPVGVPVKDADEDVVAEQVRDG